MVGGKYGAGGAEEERKLEIFLLSFKMTQLAVQELYVLLFSAHAFPPLSL